VPDNISCPSCHCRALEKDSFLFTPAKYLSPTLLLCSLRRILLCEVDLMVPKGQLGLRFPMSKDHSIEEHEVCYLKLGLDGMEGRIDKL